MWYPFSNSARSLQADGVRIQTASLALGMMLSVAVGIWGTLARVPVYVSASSAQVDTLTLPRHVQSLVEGQVLASHLVLGTRVAEGDLLVELDARTEKADLVGLRGQKRGIEAELAALGDQIEKETQAVSASRHLKSSTIREAHLKKQQANPRVELSDERAARAAGAADGVFSDFEKHERDAAARDQRLARDVLRAGADRVAWEQLLAVSSREVRLQELTRERARLEAAAETKEAAAARLEIVIERHLVRAAAPGYVGNLSDLAVGTVVKPSDVLAVVVPAEELKLIANVPADSGSGVLRQGQEARVRFPAFPWTEYGSCRYTVDRVATQATSGAIRVELSMLAKPTSSVPIRQGMVANVDVEVERVSPVTLVLRSLGARRRVVAPPTSGAPDSRVVSR